MNSDLVYGTHDALNSLQSAINDLFEDVAECAKQAHVAMCCGDEDHTSRVLRTLRARAIGEEADYFGEDSP